MQKKVTIVISPRDRFTGVDECISEIYALTDHALFDLIVLDLGYPASIMRRVREQIADKDNARIVNYGLSYPVEGIRRIREEISTPYTILFDNDSRPTRGWLEPLIESAEQGAAVVCPLTLEAAGVNKGADLRNHSFTCEIRVVNISGDPCLIEYKPFLRSLKKDLPLEITPTQAFELHCVLFSTEVLQRIEIPQMVIREHNDIGMQLQAAGETMVSNPASVIVYDNLGTRMTLSDLRYFNYRWAKPITYASSRLFEKRWGYKFYGEEKMYNWVDRRRLFLLLRWLYVPINLSNTIVNAINRIKTRLHPEWNPLKDPVGASVQLYDTLENRIPMQEQHSIFL